MLYGPNGGQANHARFQVAEFDRLYELQNRLPNGPERLAATTYTHDEEAWRIWRDEIGLPPERIQLVVESVRQPPGRRRSPCPCRATR